MAKELSHFYLNIVLLNGSEVVKDQVKEKAGTGVFGKVLGGAAAKVISDEKLLAKLTETLEEKLEETMDEMGLHLKFVKVFSKKSLSSFRVNLHEIQKEVLLMKSRGEEFAKAYSQLLGSLMALGLEDKLPTLDEKVNEKVQSKLMEQLEVQIPAKLSENGVKCSVSVLSPAEQADYFFDTLQMVC